MLYIKRNLHSFYDLKNEYNARGFARLYSDEAFEAVYNYLDSMDGECVDLDHLRFGFYEISRDEIINDYGYLQADDPKEFEDDLIFNDLLEYLSRYTLVLEFDDDNQFFVIDPNSRIG